MTDFSLIVQLVGQQVKVSTYQRVWVGKLVEFGDRWLVIEEDGSPVAISLAEGLSVELLSHAEEKARKEHERMKGMNAFERYFEYGKP